MVPWYGIGGTSLNRAAKAKKRAPATTTAKKIKPKLAHGVQGRVCIQSHTPNAHVPWRAQDRTSRGLHGTTSFTSSYCRAPNGIGVVADESVGMGEEYSVAPAVIKCMRAP